MPSNKKTAIRIEAEKLCKQFPKVSSRTLAKRLAAEFKSTIEQARNLVRYIRGNKGNERRKYAKARRPNGKSGWKPTPPPVSLAEPWLPFVLDGVKRVGIISDVHIPYHDSKAFPIAVKDLKRRKIDCLVINGDFADFYTISRHQKNPKKRDFGAERLLIREGLAFLRGEFNHAQIVFKKGNHEERWDHWLWNHAPEVCDQEFMKMENWLDFDKFGIDMVEDQRPIMVGKLPVLHGHELGKGFIAPVNPARGAFLRTHHTVLVGHSHQGSNHTDTNMWHDETVGWSTGCLCDLSPEYARINRWNHGFAFVEVSADGSFQVENCRIAKGGEVRRS